MKIHDLEPAIGEKRDTKRVGRGIGSGTGKTSTRGHKGQWARSGGGVRPNFEGGQMPMTRRLPKIGFNNKRFEKKYNIVNLDDFDSFNDGDKVGLAELVESGKINKVAKNGLKVLGNGELKKKVEIVAAKASKQAIEKIEKAGVKICLKQ